MPLKRDQAYLAIRTGIIRLELSPSSLIDEAALGKDLGLGRTPIREAHLRLTHEGFVTIYTRRGAVVTPISARLSFLFWRHGVYHPITAQHYEILACLRDGRGDATATLMEQHILVTSDRVARVLA